MPRNQETISGSGAIIMILVLLNGILLQEAYVNDQRLYGGLVITLPLLVAAIANNSRK